MRPRKTTGDSEVATCRGALLKLPEFSPCCAVWDVSRNPPVARGSLAGSHGIEECASFKSPTRILLESVKLLLPPQ